MRIDIRERVYNKIIQDWYTYIELLFEQKFEVIMSMFVLNSLHYYILPGYIDDCCLKTTGVSLDTSDNMLICKLIILKEVAFVLWVIATTRAKVIETKIVIAKALAKAVHLVAASLLVTLTLLNVVAFLLIVKKSNSNTFQSIDIQIVMMQLIMVNS